MRRYVIIKIKVLCPRSGSHRKVKQNDNLCPMQDSGSLAVFKVTARDQGQYLSEMFFGIAFFFQILR